MKSFATLLVGVTISILSLPAMADPDLVQNATLGTVDPAALTTTGNIEFGAPLGDRNSYQGSAVDGEFYPSTPAGQDGQVISIYMNPADTVKTVVFYDALWADGGWFGVNGATPDSSGKLTSADLAVPTLQITTYVTPTSGPNQGSYAAAVWNNVSDTNNYLNVMTGATTGTATGLTAYGIPFFGPYSPPTSVASVFNLDTAVTGITGIRLVGSAGGANSWISGYEFSVFSQEVPEPSTYAMLLGGLSVLFLVSRSRRKLSA